MNTRSRCMKQESIFNFLLKKRERERPHGENKSSNIESLYVLNSWKVFPMIVS